MSLPDHIVLASFPLVAVPGAEPLAPSLANGTRFLVAADGLYREITVPWMRAIVPLTPFCLSRTPYGELQAGVEFRFGALPMDLLRRFKKLALQNMPNECTAALIWNESSGQWRLCERKAIHATPERVDYEEATLAEDEHLVVDIHSHGAYPPDFSARDDLDDMGGLKIAAVLGNLGGGEGSLRARLVLPDRFMDLYLSADGSLSLGEAA